MFVFCFGLETKREIKSGGDKKNTHDQADSALSLTESNA
jgi:hypothetical protein